MLRDRNRYAKIIIGNNVPVENGIDDDCDSNFKHNVEDDPSIDMDKVVARVTATTDEIIEGAIARDDKNHTKLLFQYSVSTVQ